MHSPRMGHLDLSWVSAELCFVAVFLPSGEFETFHMLFMVLLFPVLRSVTIFFHHTCVFLSYGYVHLAF